jgi:hypothetical protein
LPIWSTLTWGVLFLSFLTISSSHTLSPIHRAIHDGTNQQATPMLRCKSSLLLVHYYHNAFSNCIFCTVKPPCISTGLLHKWPIWLYESQDDEYINQNDKLNDPPTLGSKFRRNSGGNSCSGPFSRNLGPGFAGIIFLGFAFLRCSKWHILKGAVLHDPPPPLQTVPRPIGEGLSIVFLAFATLGVDAINKVELDPLQFEPNTPVFLVSSLNFAGTLSNFR